MPAPRGTDLCYPCKRVERTEHGETHRDTLPADERLALDPRRFRLSHSVADILDGRLRKRCRPGPCLRLRPDRRHASLGQKSIAVKNQSADPQFAKFRENLRWSVSNVTFVTVHIVGSNDNFGSTAETDAEHLERKAANIAWIKQTFAEAMANNSRGVVLLTQANPGFENFWPPAAKTRYFIPFIPRGQALPDPTTAFGDYIQTLADEVERFEKPVAILHGDTHLFRIDKPLYSKETNRLFENFTRVQIFGWPDSHWVRITVDPADPQLFRFKAEIVPENVVNRRK